MQEWEEKALDRQEAREEGYREGRNSGIKEGQKISARKLLEKGMAIEDVSEVTGLSVEEVTHLNL